MKGGELSNPGFSHPGSPPLAPGIWEDGRRKSIIWYYWNSSADGSNNWHFACNSSERIYQGLFLSLALCYHAGKELKREEVYFH